MYTQAAEYGFYNVWQLWNSKNIQIDVILVKYQIKILQKIYSCLCVHVEQ